MGEDSQESQAKYTEERVLLPPGYVQGPHNGQRQQENEEVGDHEESCVGPPHRLRMAVLFRDADVPVGLQRDAGGKDGQNHVDVADDDDGKDHLAYAPDPLEAEDVKVQQEDRDLGHAERQGVELEVVPAGLQMSVSMSVGTLVARRSGCLRAPLP